MYGLSVTTEPAVEPVSVEEAKVHLRVEHESENDYIAALVKAARQFVEGHLDRALITQTVKLSLDAFPCGDEVIRLPRSPVQSIASVTYIDDAGTTQTLASTKYRLDSESLVPRLTPAYGETWPTTRETTNAVTISFVAGYGAAGSVPEPIKQAMKLLIGTYYDPVRATVSVGSMAFVMPNAAEYLLGPYRVATQAGA